MPNGKKIGIGYKWLVISLAFLLIALLLKFVLAGLLLSEDTVARNLETDIKREVESVDAVATSLQEKLQKGEAGWSDYLVESPYPFFIFQNGQLEFWSDYHYIPNYFEVRYIDNLGLLVTRNGYYLVRRYRFETAGGVTDIAFTIPVFWSPGLENQYLRSSYNERLLRHNFFTLIEDPSVFEERNIIINNQFLFSISIPAGIRITSPFINAGSFFFSIIALFFLVLFLEKLLAFYFVRQRFFRGLLFWLLLVLLLRYLMVIGNFPFHSSQWGLFASRNLQLGQWVNHPADFLLHVLAGIWIGTAIWRAFLHPSSWLWLRRVRMAWQVLGILFLSFLAAAALWAVYQANISLSSGLPWSLDIAEEVSFTAIKLFALLSIFLIGLLFFILSHLLIKIMLLLKGNFFKPFFMLAYLFLPALVLILLLPSSWPAMLIYVLYTSLLLFTKWPLQWKKYQLNALTYGLIACVAVAAAGSSGELEHQKNQREQEMNQLANYLLAEGDAYTEFRLDDVKYRIENDVFIRNRLLDPFQNQSVIEQKIRRAYIKNDFDKYDVTVHVFDSQGMPVYEISQGLTYTEYRLAVEQNGKPTAFRGLYQIPEQSNLSALRYFLFADLTIANGIRIGTVMLELQRKRFFPNTLLPELLVDRGRKEQSLERGYDFAVYNQGIQVYSGGAFNYPTRIENSLFEDFSFNRQQRTFQGYQHIFFSREGGKSAIISAPSFPLGRWAGNFSFRFLLLVFVIFIIVIVYSSLQWQRGKPLRYSRKIQLYLNLAFFIPLIVISVSTLGRINLIFNADLEEDYFRKAQSAATALSSTLDEYLQGRLSAEQLDEEIIRLAKFLQTDLTVFGLDGRLYGVSQASIYENNLLSGRVNPRAYAQLVEWGESGILLNENIGTLDFRTVYYPLRSPDNGSILGILGMPFFESASDLQQKQSAILSNILVTFTVVFILFFFMAYLVSNVLSFPFTYLSARLRRLSLTEQNEPLNWKNDDEIGLLIREYNRMLVNLERNKKALAQSEKESAWREMAKQVAHEIKNPLTPMKLSLQQMQRTLRRQDSGEEERLQKQIQALLQQVDTLSDIASSFSAFARMPTPESEVFDLVALVRENIRLFENDPEVQLSTRMEVESAWVLADRKLMSRIISNLFINGIQATREDVASHLRIALKVGDKDEVVLSIQDNGTGIPPEIQEKVFSPNFSTKTSGSGLGLAIARHGVEHAGGRIWFETSQEWGTTFYIALPLQG